MVFSDGDCSCGSFSIGGGGGVNDVGNVLFGEISLSVFFTVAVVFEEVFSS